MSRAKSFIIFILALGTFGIINTEMGIIGILPQIAEKFGVSVSHAGLLVSLFALAVAIAGPILPLAFSRVNRKSMMLIVFGLFILSNIISVFASSFTVVLIARIIPAFFHPVYFSVAFTFAATLVNEDQVPKVVSKIFMGMTAGMIIGIPITSFIANISSIEMAMLFFAVINVMTFLAILIFVPSMPVLQKISYGAQLSVLKKPVLWISMAAAAFIVSGVYAVFSFFTEYLTKVTHMSSNSISLMLVLFGVTGIIGNVLAGKWLTNNAVKTALLFPFTLGIVYVLIYFMGSLTIPMIAIILVWGILFTMGINIAQYWITSSALEAPDFANGLFVAFANLGVTIGSTVGGAFISRLGTSSVVWSGIIFMILAFLMIALRTTVFRYSFKKVTAANQL
ncbi:arabinose ABC transporter permease [Bacillus sp. FJAT-27264]|uniref:MFS transporter n=1 Tax=Paenibacillus sp. (strain DSM 101736 / FJAT-27264) TaxID=1850362 RepID=UPI000807BFDA|nr:MFS transporter [Bacillus sp. FJAT-27264]OBZ14177.1 arabinose ABC transporter permease [Bacillus sp. FJAT-27264]